MISTTVAFSFFPPKLFGLLWYLIAIVCAVLTIKNWKKTSFGIVNVWLIAFTPLLIVSVASVFIHNLTIGRVEILELYVGGLLFTAGFQHLIINYQKIILGAKIAAVLGLFFACYEVFYLGHARAGVDVNPINFGFGAGIIGVLLAVKWCGLDNERTSVKDGLFTLSALLALIISGSRGPFLAFSVTLICLLSIRSTYARNSKRGKLKTKIFSGLLVFYIGLGSLIFLPRTYHEITNPNPTSVKIRLELLREGITQILETPLQGVGSDQAGVFLRSLENPVMHDFNHLHSTPMNLSLELGVLGGLTYLWAIFFLTAYFLKARTWAHSKFVWTGMSLVLFIFISSLSNEPLSHSYARKLIAFYLALCLILLHKSNKKKIYRIRLTHL